MANINQILSDFDNADPSQGGGSGSYISIPGTHKVEVEAVKLRESETSSKLFLIVEFKVLNSTASDLGVVVGGTYAWVHDLTNKFFGASNAKQFIAAAVGLNPGSAEAKAIGRKELEEAWGDDQVLTGQVLTLKTVNRTTKSGGDFTVHNWTPGE